MGSVGKAGILALLMFVVGVAPVASATASMNYTSLEQLINYAKGKNFDPLAEYNGIGKEYIKEISSGKYVVKFDENISEKERKKILGSISEYRKKKALEFIKNLKAVGAREGIAVSPQKIFHNKVKALQEMQSKNTISPLSTQGDCYYLPSYDITICAGYDEKIEYWRYIGKHVRGQTHFVVYCDGVSFTDCELEGWSAGECIEGTVMDKITLTTTVTLHGISPSISWPPSFTPSGNSGTMTDSFENTESAFHQYTGLHATSWFGFWKFEQDDDANFKKGNGAIHVLTEVYFQ